MSCLYLVWHLSRLVLCTHQQERALVVATWWFSLDRALERPFHPLDVRVVARCPHEAPRLLWPDQEE